MKKLPYLAASSNTITSLIAMLNSDDSLARAHARKSLVKIGSAAVPSLIQILTDPQDRLRWEAAKALSQIGDPAAASALVKALDDDNSGIRWLAAEGLVILGRAGLVPLLEALRQHSDSVRLREGAHHVLRSLAREDLCASIVTPVLAVLEDIEPAIQLPLVAHAALRMLIPAPDWH
jgi:HEAT repeat protein